MYKVLLYVFLKCSNILNKLDVKSVLVLVPCFCLIQGCILMKDLSRLKINFVQDGNFASKRPTIIILLKLETYNREKGRKGLWSSFISFCRVSFILNTRKCTKRSLSHFLEVQFQRLFKLTYLEIGIIKLHLEMRVLLDYYYLLIKCFNCFDLLL